MTRNDTVDSHSPPPPDKAQCRILRGFPPEPYREADGADPNYAEETPPATETPDTAQPHPKQAKDVPNSQPGDLTS